MGTLGGIAIVVTVVLILAYRNYKYEQELDSLMWKIDPCDFVVIDTQLLKMTLMILYRNYCNWFDRRTNLHPRRRILLVKVAKCL